MSWIFGLHNEVVLFVLFSVWLRTPQPLEPMTTPMERARALRCAGELLLEVQQSSKCGTELKDQVRSILRHYPSNEEIARCARLMQWKGDPWMNWLAPEGGG